MGEEAVDRIASAVTAVVADRAVSKFLDNFNRQAAADEKLQRLERLLLMIRSTVEVSEKHAIESATLLQWQEKLREAVSHGDEVLLSFQQRATDEAAAAHQNGNDQQAAGGSSTTTPGTSTAALSFTRNALSSMARRICSAATALFASDEDMKKLGSAVEALEKEWENIGEFIRLLDLEASPKRKRRRTKVAFRGYVCYDRTRARNLAEKSKCAGIDGVSLPEESCHTAYLGLVGGWSEEGDGARGWSGGGGGGHSGAAVRGRGRGGGGQPGAGRLWRPAGPEAFYQAETAYYRELPELVKRLQEALLGISRSVNIVKGWDIKELEWLSNWADVLRDARQQGSNVLDAVTAMARMETVECGFETDQLRSFVLTMESLAGDARYFLRLASLAPVRET